MTTDGPPNPPTDPTGWVPRWANQLSQLQAQDLRRQLPNPQPGAALADFASNDYLSLARNPARAQAFAAHLARHPLPAGATGSRLLTGHTPEHARLEAQLAQAHHTQAALVFPSAYQANLAVFGALMGRTDTVLYDARVHASTREALRLAGCRAHAFEHNNQADLAARLAQTPGPVAVAAEALYSMDGDTPELAALWALCQQHEALLVLDEAHSLGVLGPQGLGLAHAHLPPQALGHPLLVRVLGFGKALGAQGGAVVAAQPVADLLLNRARAFIYTTGLSPWLAWAVGWGYAQLPGLEAERTHIYRLQAQLHSALASHPAWQPGAGPLAFWRLGNPAAALQAAHQLQAQALDVRPIRPPTVPPGQAGLRLILHAHNTPAQVAQLAQALLTL